MSELNLEAIKARCEAATPGPWHYHLDNLIAHPNEDYPILVEAGSYEGLSREQQKALVRNNRIFVAHARSDVPALVAEVERLRAALEDCEESKVYPEW